MNSKEIKALRKKIHTQTEIARSQKDKQPGVALRTYDAVEKLQAQLKASRTPR